MLIVEDVSTSFGKRKILENVNFHIEPRSIVAITGKSGTGKTTLLGVMSGFLKPDEGRVIYNGQDIFKWSDFKRSRFRNREIGFVFQFFNLLPDITSYDNIIYPAILNPSAGNIKKEVDYLVEYLDLGNIINQYPTTLSGGERQRVSIARAIINNPKIILADEPTGNLDEKSAGDIISLFKMLREKRGITTIIVTHDEKIVKNADINYHLEETRLVEFKLRKVKKPSKK